LVSLHQGLLTTVSIHAPARGATNGDRGLPNVHRCFNPRTREGCDEVVVMLYIFDSTVSIHAPARGATCLPLSHHLSSKKFQSTHPRGVRRLPLSHHLSSKKFQSTHPRGVRRIFARPSIIGVGVSIHAPARGATLYALYNPTVIEVSIHAPARGATQLSIGFRLPILFQSTHPRGVRHGKTL